MTGLMAVIHAFKFNYKPGCRHQAGGRYLAFFAFLKVKIALYLIIN